MVKWMRNAILLSLLVVIAGCQGFGGSQPTDANQVQDTYRVGSEALTMDFVNNFPPNRIFDNEAVDPQSYIVMLEIANRGAHTLTEVNSDFYISGYDDKIILNLKGEKAGVQAKRAELLADLEGKSFFNPDGTTDFLRFEGNIQSLAGRNIEIYDTTLLVTSCYQYQTLGAAQICVDPNPFSTSAREKTCTPQSVSMGTQGAPIAVSSVDVEARKGRTRLTLHIQNVGIGDVYKSESLAECAPSHPTGLTFDDINFVKLDSVKVGDTSITPTCKPTATDGYIRLNDGQASIVCEHTVPEGSEFTTPLTVELSYGYRNSVSKRVEIVKAPE